MMVEGVAEKFLEVVLQKNNMKKFVSFLALSFLISPLMAQVRIDSSFAFGPDTAKMYSIYVPSNYNPSNPNPLMVGFHPYNVSRWNAVSWCDTLLAFSEMNDLILVCPDGDSLGIITDSLDYAFTTALMDSMKLWFNIDEERIYTMGFSFGGKAVYEYGLNNAPTFGGFIPIGAAINGTSFVSNVIQNAGRRPFYLVHGANDNPSQRYYPILNALNANCAFVNSILMSGVGHTIDFPNRNQILTTAYQWIDSVNLSPLNASFSLTSPVNFSTLTVKGFNEFEHHFFWEESPVADSCGVLKYDFMMDLPGNKFVNPLLTLPSNNGGLDTSLSLTNGQIDSLLVLFSVPINGMLALDWTAKTNINNTYSDTAKSFRITITRKNLGFSVNSPANNNVVVLQNGNNKFFNWEDLNHYITVTYELVFDDTSGDFSNPLLSYTSSTNGISSSLNVEHERLYYDFMFLNSKEIGDSVTLKWRALASDTFLSEYSQNERVITLIRGNVGFKLFVPVDNSLLTSKKDVDYTFSWDSVSLADIRYEWLFDSLGIDLGDSTSFVLGSDSDSSYARIEITFAILDSIMNFYGVQYLDTFHGQWTSRAKFDGGDEYSLNTYRVSIVRAHPVGIENHNSLTGVKIYPNPANSHITFDFNTDQEWETLELFDAISSLIYSGRVIQGEKSLTIDVSEFSEGSYIWKVNNSNNSVSGMFIISR